MGVLMNIRRLLGADSHATGDRGPANDPQPDQDDFAQLVGASLDELPEDYLRALEQVPVLVADDGIGSGAYGLYHGAGLAHPDLPAQIVIYRDSLTRDFGGDPERLAAEIRRTVRHELAHHLGYGERGVRALGL